MIYVTSDLHFCHDREFLYGPRGFASCAEMNEAIVKNWNALIKWDDEVYVLGDLMLKDDRLGIYYWNQLVGKKHIILGNHDTDTRIELYKQCHDTVVEGHAMRLKYGNNTIMLSHYPMLVGDKHEEGKSLKNCVINLCGHVHTKDKFYNWDKGLIYHVELDAHENKPVSIEQIMDDIRKKI
ncbi:MAG: hypothetical protein IJ757_00505 [Clostridiales bacterium]|nr:hypothetical protein [Clostridiales bacterium]